MKKQEANEGELKKAKGSHHRRKPQIVRKHLKKNMKTVNKEEEENIRQRKQQ